MTIQYCSDLHLEFPENKEYIKSNPIIPKADILILAGDIVPFNELEKHDYFFDDISKKFKEVFWIPGNHEYYLSDTQGRVGIFKEEIRTNVHLLNNHSVEIGNTKIILSTLWSKIPDDKIAIIEHSLNDFHIIKYNTDRFRATMCNALFDENFKFIQKEVENNTKEKCLIVTHHVPTFTNYPKQYLGSPINSAFATDLDDFITNSNIDAWIFGHNHANVLDFKVGETVLATNQLGYVRAREHFDFDGTKVIEL